MVHTIGGDAGPCGDIDGIAGKNCAGVGILRFMGKTTILIRAHMTAVLR